jgi:hypothetical protein
MALKVLPIPVAKRPTGWRIEILLSLSQWQQERHPLQNAHERISMLKKDHLFHVWQENVAKKENWRDQIL